MRPVLVEIGGFSLYSYGFMIALALLVALILLYRRAPAEGFDPELVMESVLVLGFAGIIGARLLYIILQWDFYRDNLGSLLHLRGGGLSFYGAFAGGLLALVIWCRLRKVPFLKVSDFFAPYLALGYSFGRIGCFLNGCCYGKETGVPWALPASMVDNLPRHPVQLYAAAGALVIFLLLLYFEKHRPFTGFNLLALPMLYGLLRFGTEFFREEVLYTGPLTLAQLFSLGLFLVTAGVILYRLRVSPTKNRSSKKKSGKRK